MRKFFKRKQMNNKGFSLVELIISFALLGFVAIGVFMVMSAGSTLFTNVDRQINIQYKSQTAMAQFQQYFMGCSKGITKYDETNHIIYFADSSNIYAFKFIPATGESNDDTGTDDTGTDDTDDTDTDKGKKIYFVSSSYDTAETDMALDASYQLFCSDVEDFSIENIPKTGTVAQSVKVNLTISDSSGKTYTTSQIFSFRNKPVYIAKPANGGMDLLSTLIATLTGTLDDD